MLETPKALTKPTCILRRVAKRKPNNLCILIGESTFRYLPNPVRDGRGFIENEHDPLAFVVEALESLGIVLAPGNEVRAPQPLMLLVSDRDAGRLDLPPVDVDAQAKPFVDFRDRLGGKLGCRVGSGDDLAIFAGALRPVRDHRYQS